ncbi:DUF3105 domain-containing protein [Streptomyces althioticus]|uniref:DUF3105 domain-containing protein n=1 Tax=Actinomycetes TaxID=1760 RepID=UPI00073A652B|nr:MULTISPECIES: DUF3105 domain-containing protein [Actinomycetes]ALV49875.1 hypothetical protein ASR50_10910 [Streptomyces sp. 4F]MBM4831215.1 DUF3105 domain-containing protein [Actinospica acidiphila]GGQ44706.1 membrane protein [Streptomyces althioticus]GGT50108.1 membrane protein [Streptomyces matensis]
MGSAKKSSAARTARIEEMRRAEQARERRNRILVVAASVVVVAGLVAGGVVLVRAQSDDGGNSSAADDAKTAGTFVTDADGVRAWKGELGREHVTKSVDYPVTPPVGGDHNPVWMNCDGDVYEDEINTTNAVHSLEHGAVWVTYNGDAPKAEVEALAAKVKKTPYTLMSPVDGQKDPLVLTAWGHQRTVKGATDPAVDAFLEKFVQGQQTPEPGAACTGGLSK